MVINTNISAQMASANLINSQAMLSKSLARLSSGSKITDASDDPAGLASATRMNSQVNRLNAAQSNVGNAISFAQTQDGFLSNVGKALDRMSQLSIMSQDSTKTDSDRSLYDKEFQTLSSYITEAATKDFNGVSLFGASALPVTTDGDGGKFLMTGINLNAAAYTNATGANVATSVSAVAALTAVKAAITELTTDRATVGASESRLNYTNDQLSVNVENLTAASSAITDVDVATESTNFARANILVQAGTSMLAQANQSPQTVLKLLQ